MNERARKATADIAGMLRSAHLLGQLSATCRDEYELQARLRSILPCYARAEVELAIGERIDFVVRGATLPEAIDVGIEVKVAGQMAAVMRQLGRYLAHNIGGLVLVTTKSYHRLVPRVIADKPVEVVWLRGL